MKNKVRSVTRARESTRILDIEAFFEFQSPLPGVK